MNLGRDFSTTRSTFDLSISTCGAGVALPPVFRGAAVADAAASTAARAIVVMVVGIVPPGRSEMTNGGSISFRCSAVHITPWPPGHTVVARSHRWLSGHALLVTTGASAGSGTGTAHATLSGSGDFKP